MDWGPPRPAGGALPAPDSHSSPPRAPAPSALSDGAAHGTVGVGAGRRRPGQDRASQGGRSRNVGSAGSARDHEGRVGTESWRGTGGRCTSLSWTWCETQRCWTGSRGATHRARGPAWRALEVPPTPNSKEVQTRCRLRRAPDAAGSERRLAPEVAALPRLHTSEARRGHGTPGRVNGVGNRLQLSLSLLASSPFDAFWPDPLATKDPGSSPPQSPWSRQELLECSTLKETYRKTCGRLTPVSVN